MGTGRRWDKAPHPEGWKEGPLNLLQQSTCTMCVKIYIFMIRVPLLYGSGYHLLEKCGVTHAYIRTCIGDLVEPNLYVLDRNLHAIACRLCVPCVYCAVPYRTSLRFTVLKQFLAPLSIRAYGRPKKTLAFDLCALREQVVCVGCYR